MHLSMLSPRNLGGGVTPGEFDIFSEPNVNFPSLKRHFWVKFPPLGSFFTSDVDSSVKFPSLGHREYVEILIKLPAFDVNFPWSPPPFLPWGLTLIGALRLGFSILLSQASKEVGFEPFFSYNVDGFFLSLATWGLPCPQE